MERLDKLLCSQTTLTRSEAGRLIRQGRVFLDGAPCRDPARRVDPENAVLVMDGREVGFARHVYLMLNKPAGVLCVSRDPKVPTVIDLLPEELRRRGLFPAGRLDKDTHGLTLITDDGDLAHRMLSPRHHVPKTYLVRLDEPVDDAAAEAFRAGPTLADGTKCMSARLTFPQPEDRTFAEVVICEGKFHQIKRMFLSVGRTVVWLKRIRIGGLLLDESLPEGAARPLTESERMNILPKNEDRFLTGR